jgi:hypothetical protein
LLDLTPFVGFELAFVPGPLLHVSGKVVETGQTVELGVIRVELGGAAMKLCCTAVNPDGALLRFHGALGCA